MNKTDSKKFKMITGCDSFLNDNEIKWNFIPAFLQYKSQLSANVINIRELNKKSATTESVSVTKNKENVKTQLGLKVEVIAGINTSYFEANNMGEFLEKSKFGTTDLAHTRETNVEAVIKTILTTSREFLPQLADSGLTEEMVAEAEALLDEYTSLIGKPRNVRNQQNTTKQSLSDLIKATIDLFTKHIDKLMLQFKEKDPDFYNGYLRSRIIVESATKHREKEEDEKAAK